MNHLPSVMRRTPSPNPGINTDPNDVRPVADDTDRRSSLHSTGSFRMGESEDGRFIAI